MNSEYKERDRYKHLEPGWDFSPYNKGMYHQCRIILWLLKLHSIMLCQSFAKSAIKTTYLSKRVFFLRAANLLFSWLKAIWSLSDFSLQHKFACNIEINSLFSKCLWITPLPICHPMSKMWHSCIYKHFIHLGFLSDALRLYFRQILFLLILQFHVCLSCVQSLVVNALKCYCNGWTHQTADLSQGRFSENRPNAPILMDNRPQTVLHRSSLHCHYVMCFWIC